MTLSEMGTRKNICRVLCHSSAWRGRDMLLSFKELSFVNQAHTLAEGEDLG